MGLKLNPNFSTAPPKLANFDDFCGFETAKITLFHVLLFCNKIAKSLKLLNCETSQLSKLQIQTFKIVKIANLNCIKLQNCFKLKKSNCKNSKPLYSDYYPYLHI